MLDIAICDDDIYLSGYLDEELHVLGSMGNVKIDIEVYQDGKEILKDVEEGKQFDIIFMDIVMKEMNGIKTANKIRELDRTVQLIYVTSHEDYMSETFCTWPIGFLQKPVVSEQLRKLFFRVLKLIGESDDFYRFCYKKATYKLLTKKILYCEGQNRKTQIVTENKSYAVFQRLALVETELSKTKSNFIRIHESYLVNYYHVVRFSFNVVEMSNGENLPVSRSSVKEAMNIFRCMWEE